MTDDRPTHAEPDELTRAEAYREWLGVERVPPTCYDLLRLPNLISDPKTIFEAGRQAKRKLRAYQIGRFRQVALDLLAEVGQAVSILTNPQRKRAYDNEMVAAHKRTIERLYEEHCRGRPHVPAVLESWLTACREAGAPVVLLMPWCLRLLVARTGRWPAHGEHELSLPACLGLYRDVVILGQCLRDGSVEQRAHTVKRVQKALGIPEGLARIVAAEVSRGVGLFGELRLAQQARRDPATTILRLARRIRRQGGHIGRRSKTLVSAAALVGRSRHDLLRILGRLDEPPVEIPAARRVALAARKAHRRARTRGRQAGEWVVGRPQILLGVGLAIGMAALVAALLIVLDVWRPWTREAPVPPPPQEVQPEKPPPAEPPPERPAEPPADLKEWEEFKRKYPAGAATSSCRPWRGPGPCAG